MKTLNINVRSACSAHLHWHRPLLRNVLGSPWCIASSSAYFTNCTATSGVGIRQHGQIHCEKYLVYCSRSSCCNSGSVRPPAGTLFKNGTVTLPSSRTTTLTPTLMSPLKELVSSDTRIISASSGLSGPSLKGGSFRVLCPNSEILKHSTVNATKSCRILMVARYYHAALFFGVQANAPLPGYTELPALMKVRVVLAAIDVIRVRSPLLPVFRRGGWRRLVFVTLVQGACQMTFRSLPKSISEAAEVRLVLPVGGVISSALPSVV